MDTIASGQAGRRSARRFSSDEQGMVAIMVALLLLPMLAGVFAAIDFGRATSLKTSLQTAADAAIFAAATRLGEDDARVRSAFAMTFKANLPESLQGQAFDLSIGNDKKSVSVSMTARFETTLIAIAGIREFNFDIHAQANQHSSILAKIAKGQPVDLERMSAADEKVVKAQMVRELTEGLKAARAAGLPVPGNIDPAQLEQAAELVLRQLSGRR